MVPDRGHGGYRRVIIALVGFLIVGPAAARPDNGEPSRSGPNSEAKADHQTTDRDAPIAYQDPRQTGSYQADCQEPENREDSDLCAQWGAVKGVLESNRIAREATALAQRANELSLAGLALNAIQAAGLIFTLIFTGMATIAAMRASRAAADAVHAERAWMSFDSHSFFPIENSSFGQKVCRTGLGINIKWRNKGRSPALRVTMMIDDKLIDPGDLPPIFDIKTAEMSKSDTTPIGTEQHVETNMAHICDSDFVDFMQRKKRWVIYSRIHYMHIWDKNITRHTEMCAELVCHGMMSEPASGRTVPNLGFYIIGDQNSAT